MENNNNNFIVGDDDDNGENADVQLTKQIIDIFKDFKVDVSTTTPQVVVNNKKVDENQQYKDEQNHEDDDDEGDDEDNGVIYGGDDDYYDDEDEDEEQENQNNENSFEDTYFSYNNNNNNNNNNNKPLSYINNNNNNNNNTRAINQPPPYINSSSNNNNNNNNKIGSLNRERDRFNTSIGELIESYKDIEFLKSQNIYNLGDLATMEDSFIDILSELGGDDLENFSSIKIYQSLARDLLKRNDKLLSKEEAKLYVNSNFLLEQANRLSPILVLYGTTIEDENNLKKLGIITLGQLSESNERLVISNDSRLSFYSFMARKLLVYTSLLNSNEISNAIYKPPAPIKLFDKFVYFYCSLEVAESIRFAKCIKSPKTLFEDYIKANVNIRFNHPWRKIYFTYHQAASRHCGTSSPTDLEVYSYLVWRSSSSRGISFDNCLSGPKAIYLFWEPVPYSNYLGIYAKEFECKFKINITQLLNDKENSLYYCQRKEGSTSLEKDIWIKYENNKPTDSKSFQQFNNYWSLYEEGSDPKLTIPHLAIVTKDGNIHINDDSEE